MLPHTKTGLILRMHSVEATGWACSRLYRGSCRHTQAEAGSSLTRENDVPYGLKGIHLSDLFHLDGVHLGFLKQVIASPHRTFGNSIVQKAHVISMNHK